ncbi:MAG: hypothetical protein RL757_1725 [Bacteroidota bacterium]
MRQNFNQQPIKLKKIFTMRNIIAVATVAQRILGIIVLLTIFTPHFNPLLAQNADRRIAYVERFRTISVKEMERTGIPASIKLAQGILESGAGTSTLSTQGNNHFGIKCHADWDGAKMYREDDDYDESGKLIKSCFRVYKNADESYIAHSEFLRTKDRYAFMFNANTKDYEFWAKGLQQAGYATAQTYAQSLINIIEDLQLNQYDNLLPNDPVFGGNGRNRKRPTSNGIFYNNDVKAFLTSGKVSLEQIAGRFDVSVRNLKNYNECIANGSDPLPDSTIVYLQSKSGYSHDRETKYHYVKVGETMCQISQRYGIGLAKLYRKNGLPEGTEPLAGEKLILRRSNIFGLWLESWETPKFRNAGEPDPNTPATRPNNGGEFGEPNASPPVSGTQKPVKTGGKTTKPSKNDKPDELDLEITPGQAGRVGTVKTESKPSVEPNSTATNGNNAPVTPVPAAPLGTFHTVSRGETLWNISKKYATTVEKIQQLNNLPNTNIAIGQRLRVK